MRLIMPNKLWRCLGNIGPLCKPFPPPFILLINVMKLGQIERNQFDFWIRNGCMVLFERQVDAGFIMGFRTCLRRLNAFVMAVRGPFVLISQKKSSGPYLLNKLNIFCNRNLSISNPYYVAAQPRTRLTVYSTKKRIISRWKDYSLWGIAMRVQPSLKFK